MAAPLRAGDCLQTNDSLLDCYSSLLVASNASAANQSGGLAPGHVYFEYPEEMLVPWVINEYFSFIVVTYLVTFVVGVSGNLVVVSVMAGDKASRNVTSVFLVSLAVSDLLLLTICAPLDVAHYFVIHWDAGATICKLAAYAETVSAFASVLNMVAVTLER
ncbi:neuropeptide Y receptor, putative [Ixodes scapularis]|uniref:Neuropeptide Y receptor, putative n=2 Tax=Ixodes scapularis TaxID=6945 RepID=B7PAV4_IXOSC|nr:neuropeptide Y receptor, putative [Ixodes scapularis]|eukprot:XP_002407282.1 neuropeptide Y receptor, putative [Ixodes scapularis]